MNGRTNTTCGHAGACNDWTTRDGTVTMCDTCAQTWAAYQELYAWKAETLTREQVMDIIAGRVTWQVC